VQPDNNLHYPLDWVATTGEPVDQSRDIIDEYVVAMFHIDQGRTDNKC
jgi:hypothetical protein